MKNASKREQNETRFTYVEQERFRRSQKQNQSY